MDMELLGTTIDDAAGEAFDKVASILRLGYPGGPAIDKAARGGNPEAVRFPRSLLAGDCLDFSFSGIKTAVLYHVNGVPGARGEKPRGEAGASGAPRHSKRRAGPARQRLASQPNAGRGIENFTPAELADVAASFQAAVVDVLKIKLRRAAGAVGARTLLLGGGVAANSVLRAALEKLADQLGCQLRMPELRFCMDNAAMIAGLGYHYLKAGKVDDLTLSAQATVRR
jgi:N6-L-threonylcarbamoyladenine synthase